MTYGPAGSTRAVAYAWTARGQLHTVTDSGALLATYHYDLAGRRTHLVHENDTTQATAYDTNNRLTGNWHVTTSSMTTFGGSTYGYDSLDRRRTENFADGATPAREYGYAPVGWVTTADYGGGADDSYVYDPAGNRDSATIFSQGGGTIDYQANDANQYISITGAGTISHDANGNLTARNGVTYVWDSHNRLIELKPTSPSIGDKSLVYAYDGLHRRILRTEREWNGSWTDVKTIRFLYDGWNVVEEYVVNSSTLTLERTLTWGADLSGSLQGAGGVGGLLMVHEQSGTHADAYHFHYDGNGNVTQITDFTGDIDATYRYDVYGNALSATGSYALANRYRFSTKPIDYEVPEALLYYYGYRYYDPVSGSWPSRDPIEEAGGVNLYSYVENDPGNETDLLGLKNGPGAEESPKEAAHAAGVAAHRVAKADYLEERERILGLRKTTAKHIPMPTGPREHGGRVCCHLDEATGKRTFYTTETTGDFPTGANQPEIELWKADSCDEGDKLAAWWHIHPESYRFDIDGDPYFSAGHSRFSPGDKTFVAGYFRLQLLPGGPGQYERVPERPHARNPDRLPLYLTYESAIGSDSYETVRYPAER